MESDFDAAIQTAHDSVVEKLEGLQVEYIDMCRLPDLSLRKICMECSWYCSAGLTPANACYQGLRAVVVEGFESVMMLNSLRGDLSKLMRALKRAQKDETTEDVLFDAWSAVAEDLRLMTSRTAFLATMDHLALPLLDRTERMLPKASSDASIGKMCLLHLSDDLQLETAIPQTLDFYRDPTLNMAHYSTEGLKKKLSDLELYLKVAMGLLKFKSPLPSFHGDSKRCKSLVCQYMTSVSPNPSETAKHVEEIVAKWKKWIFDGNLQSIRERNMLHRQTWSAMWRVNEDRWRPALSDKGVRVLNSLLVPMFTTGEIKINTPPGRKTKSQLLAEVRARKNQQLLAPGTPITKKPRKDSDQEASEVSETFSEQKSSLTPSKKTPKFPDLSKLLISATHTHPSSREWPEPATPRPSQFGAEPEPRSSAKVKTRARTSCQPTVESDDEDEEADRILAREPERDQGSRLIFTSRKDYMLWRELFPNPGDKSIPLRTGELKFDDFHKIMTHPPISFRSVYVRAVEVKFERDARDGWPKGVFTMHRPHSGNVLYRSLLGDMRERLRKTFGWRGEHFVLEE